MAGLWLIILLAILSTQVTHVAHADAPAAAAPVPAATLSVEAIRSDFDLLQHALEEAHPGLYRFSTKAEMDRMFAAERAKLERPMTRLQFREVVAETLASMRCGHTSMDGDAEIDAALKSSPAFPLSILIEGHRIMVLLNDTASDQTIRPGMEIVDINGHKASDLLGHFYRVTSADGDIETGKNHDVIGRFRMYYWWLIEQPKVFIITAKDSEGKTVVAKLPGVTDAERKSNHNPVNAKLMTGASKVLGAMHVERKLSFIKDPQIAEIRLHYFLGNDYRQWMRDTFKTLHDKGSKALIIDLRGNGGGEDEYGALLVSELTDKPFRYFDHINIKTFKPSFDEHLDGHFDAGAVERFSKETVASPAGGYRLTSAMVDGLNEQQPAAQPFMGKVIILTEGGSFSCSGDVCAILHHLHRATFVGEETGGGYWGNNSGRMPTMTLPNSNQKFRFPFFGYWNAVEGDDAFRRRGIIPDVQVELKTADLLRGVDAQHDMAVKLAEESVAAAK
jgi:C-terminal processing protease CtpA/Prc